MAQRALRGTALQQTRHAGACRHAAAAMAVTRRARTLAFCVSITRTEYMATQFQREGIACAAVYAGSRSAAATP